VELPTVSVVIPTFEREQVLIDTVRHVLALDGPRAEVLVVDQTASHEAATTAALEALAADGRVRWLRLTKPSITHAMNVGIAEATGEVVLFLDDDVIPDARLLVAHARAQAAGARIVAGLVRQPWDGHTPSIVRELMGGNVSISRRVALRLGGFDENFVHVAYRFEAEFAARALAAGEPILFEPEASIHHLKISSGGTRTYGDHLRTLRPSHAVGAYYYLLCGAGVPNRLLEIVARPLRAIRTRHHLRRPWWILPTLVAEGIGFSWAVILALQGPRLLTHANVRDAA
jgi:GT2 family glycosyltransferase